VRMVQEHRGDYTAGWQAKQSIAGKFGMHPVTPHEWVKRAEIDDGQRAGETARWSREHREP
jgi:transposase